MSEPAANPSALEKRAADHRRSSYRSPAESHPEHVALCLFRVAQEALANVIRHSKAQTVVIEGGQDRGIISLRISDDGVGFDAGVPVSGIGLTSMRERLRLVSGLLQINSSPNFGTEVIARVRIPD
jgi:two-component system, NarL family, sensor kinase